MHRIIGLSTIVRTQLIIKTSSLITIKFLEDLVMGGWGLAPSGAQGLAISVRPFGPSLSRALNLHLSGSFRSLLGL